MFSFLSIEYLNETESEPFYERGLQKKVLVVLDSASVLAKALTPVQFHNLKPVNHQ